MKFLKKYKLLIILRFIAVTTLLTLSIIIFRDIFIDDQAPTGMKLIAAKDSSFQMGATTGGVDELPVKIPEKSF